MTQKIFVFAATGDQGASVCRYLIKDGGFEVYGLTRNTESEKAKALAKTGVKLVKGDMADPASYAEGLKGMDGVFLNGDFWEPYFSSGCNAEVAREAEVSRGKGAVDAIKAAGVKHLIYSTLDDVDYCPHFAGKHEVTEYIKSHKIPNTQFYTSYYISNLVKFGMLQPKEDGTIQMGVPASDDTVLPCYAVEQTGAWVLAIFKDPKKYIGQDVLACSEKVTVAETAKIIGEFAGKKVITRGLTRETFYSEAENIKKEMNEELWIQYKMFEKGDMPRDVAKSKEIVPDQWDHRAWVKQSKEAQELFKK